MNLKSTQNHHNIFTIDLIYTEKMYVEKKKFSSGTANKSKYLFIHIYFSHLVKNE